MNIQFQKEDAVYYRAEQLRKNIADVTCANPDFIEIVCNVLLELYESTNSLTKELCDLLELHKYVLDVTEYESYKELENLLCEYYMLIQDMEFDRDLRLYNEKEYINYKLSENQNKMNVFRGILLEAIVEKLVHKRFEGNLFETGCKVIINGQLVCVFYNNGHKKQTLDIAGWHEDLCRGEFYECKLRPNKFNLENYNLLFKLENMLMRNNISNYRMIVVSADARRNLEQQIALIESEHSIKIQKLNLYGRECIRQLNDFNILDIA